MNVGAPKDNVNPTVVAVDGRKRKVVRGTSALLSLSAIRDDDDDDDWTTSSGLPRLANLSERSVEDRAIVQALVDASVATEGRGVSLLRHVGVALPTTSSTTAQQRGQSKRHHFVPAPFTASSTSYHRKAEKGERQEEDGSSWQQRQRDVLDADEIFDLIRTIQDPEHPLTLEQLAVVRRDQIEVRDVLDDPAAEPPPRGGDGARRFSTCTVRFTPTVPHCSMAMLIGLCIRVKLLRSLPSRFKVAVRVQPGTHQSENAVNRQLADKERICAALENKHLLGVVNKCIRNGMTGEMS
jgi:metal-sulfur cluster biosynthetic enzyme